MAEFVAGIIDRLRTVSLHQWLARLLLAIAGAALVAICAQVTRGTLAGVTPSIATMLLVATVIWPESIASIAFLAWSMVWWLLAWQGSIGVTVAVAVLVALVHLLCALVGGPGHSVYRARVVGLLGSRAVAYLLATGAVGAAVAALSAVPSARLLAWVAVVVLSVATLVATLVASMVDEVGQSQDRITTDEPYVRDDLS